MNHTSGTKKNTSQRQRVINLSNDCHMRSSQIKQTTDCLTSTIRRILRSNQSRHATNSRNDRSQKLISRDVRCLIRAVTILADDRAAFYVRLAKELEIETSEDTLRRALRRAGFRRCIACLKSLISWINRRKRLKWAREHLHWIIEDWLRVIYSDEATYETRQRARKFVIRRRSERHCSDCLNNFKLSDRQSVMIWEDICDTQTIDLIEFKKTSKRITREKNADNMRESITSSNYIKQILEACLLSWYQELQRLKHRSIFMQNDSFIHDSKEMLLWLRQYQIELIKHYSSSLDLNLDEYMWKAGKSAIRRYSKLITNAKDMFKVARKKWIKTSNKNLHYKWIYSMSKRCRAIIKNRDYYIKFWSFEFEFAREVKDNRYISCYMRFFACN